MSAPHRTIAPACWAAIAANDDDKVMTDCGALIDNEKTAKTDRIKALTARAAVFAIASSSAIDRANASANPYVVPAAGFEWTGAPNAFASAAASGGAPSTRTGLRPL